MPQPRPHTPEWFSALEKKNPKQAIMTRFILSRAGRDDGCSICGDDPANDYGLEKASDTIRLCDECLLIQQSMSRGVFPMTARSSPRRIIPLDQLHDMVRGTMDVWFRQVQGKTRAKTPPGRPSQKEAEWYEATVH